MVRVDLKGIAKVTAKGRTYWYAWRGGPRLRGEPGSPEFIASFNEAIEQHRAPDKSRFRSIVTEYKGSGDYKKLAQTTRDEWGKWLDRIILWRAPHRAIRSAGKDPADNSSLAQHVDGDPANGRLWNAGTLPGRRACRSVR